MTSHAHIGGQRGPVVTCLLSSAYFRFLYPSESSELHVGMLTSLQPETFNSVSPTLTFNTPKVKPFILLF